MNYIKCYDGFFVLDIKVRTNASQMEHQINLDQLVIIVDAPPDKEKANKAIIKYLSNLFDCKKEHVSIISGMHCNKKAIKIQKELDLETIIKTLQ